MSYIKVEEIPMAELQCGECQGTWYMRLTTEELNDLTTMFCPWCATQNALVGPGMYPREC